MGKKRSFQKCFQETGYLHAKKKKIRSLSYTICKYYSKWINDLNLRTKSIQLLEENIGKKLHVIAFGNDFLTMTQKAQAIKNR